MSGIFVQDVQHASVALGAANAQRSFDERASLWLTLADGDGRQGIGEVAPLDGYSPDTVSDCAAALRRLKAESLPDVTSLGDVRRIVDGLPHDLPALRFGVETALLDLLGHRTSRSVGELLGAAPADGQPGRAVKMAALAQTPDDAQRHSADGYETVKIKVGEGLRGVSSWRSVCTGVRVRFDFNQSLSRLAYAAVRAELGGFDVDFVEEPFVLHPLAEPLPKSPPIAIDESLRPGRTSVAEFARAGGRVVVLKPTVLGGLLACADLVEEAQRYNLRCVVSHTFEGRIAHWALLNFAAAVDARCGHQEVHGLGPHAGLSLWSDFSPALAGPQVVLPNRPGLGGAAS